MIKLTYGDGTLLVKLTNTKNLNIRRGNVYAKSALLHDKEKSEEETRDKPSLGRSKQRTEEIEVENNRPVFKNPFVVIECNILFV